MNQDSKEQLGTEPDAAAELVSRAQLSKRYGVHPHTWYKWDAAGSGPPSIRLGRLVRYRIVDVEAWLDSRKRGGNPQ
jgi:predicted DNA-binding transcriptional regulator AlpA